MTGGSGSNFGKVARMSSSESVSSPEVASGSRGSSVSTGLLEEYEDLLRYAVVTPVPSASVGGLPSSAKKSQTFKKSGSGVPPPRSSPPPRPHHSSETRN